MAHRHSSSDVSPDISDAPLPEQQSASPTDKETSDKDEVEWALDDLQYLGTKHTDTFANAQNEEQLFQEFQRRHPLPAYTEQQGQLPYPVCLPQRRPRQRTRGFVRAYAPALEACDIDQHTFFDFLDGFEKAIQVLSPMTLTRNMLTAKMHQTMNVLQIVVRGADLALQIAAGPSLTLHVASWVVHAGVEASRRGHIQYRTNKYLDEMNANFFRQRGLYALIMRYKPSINLLAPSDSTVQAVSRRSDGDGSKLSHASSTSRSELELSEAAPLPKAVKRAGNFLGEYYDRRAQAVFGYDNPTSRLNLPGAPAPEFASRYSDPTSAASNGGLLGLVTGGKVHGVLYRLRQKKRAERVAQGKPTGNNKILAEDVYYLMIVNYPSEEEIQEAKQTLLRGGV